MALQLRPVAARFKLLPASAAITRPAGAAAAGTAALSLADPAVVLLRLRGLQTAFPKSWHRPSEWSLRNQIKQTCKHCKRAKLRSRRAVASMECFKPLTSVEQLLVWNPATVSAASRCTTPLPVQVICPSQPQLLACHDLAGNYLEDALLHGSRVGSFHRYVHWHCTDIFCYFSHNLVTIPTPGYIHAAHVNNTKVLGTLITEWDAGQAMCKVLFASPNMAEQVARQLACIAQVYNFEGWLINIENAVAEELVPNMIHFLRVLTQSMKDRRKDAVTLWYDAVTSQGALLWQNTLNDLNRPFYDACDGIFVNYTWREEAPKQAVEYAGPGKGRSVFMGVDVFGRNTFGGGKFDTHRAVQAALEAGASVAVFAPGWSWENCQVPQQLQATALGSRHACLLQDAPAQRQLAEFPKECLFHLRDQLLWAPIAQLYWSHQLRQGREPSCTLAAHVLPGPLPLNGVTGRAQCPVWPVGTNFCHGCCTAGAPWYDLRRQQLQPLWQVTNLHIMQMNDYNTPGMALAEVANAVGSLVSTAGPWPADAGTAVGDAPTSGSASDPGVGAPGHVKSQAEDVPASETAMAEAVTPPAANPWHQLPCGRLDHLPAELLDAWECDQGVGTSESTLQPQSLSWVLGRVRTDGGMGSSGACLQLKGQLEAAHWAVAPLLFPGTPLQPTAAADAVPVQQQVQLQGNGGQTLTVTVVYRSSAADPSDVLPGAETSRADTSAAGTSHAAADEQASPVLMAGTEHLPEQYERGGAAPVRGSRTGCRLVVGLLLGPCKVPGQSSCQPSGAAGLQELVNQGGLASLEVSEVAGSGVRQDCKPDKGVRAVYPLDSYYAPPWTVPQDCWEVLWLLPPEDPCRQSTSKDEADGTANPWTTSSIQVPVPETRLLQGQTRLLAVAVGVANIPKCTPDGEGKIQQHGTGVAASNRQATQQAAVQQGTTKRPVSVEYHVGELTMQLLQQA